jgi:tetratricopeptide (TPR) repeat protein
MRFAILLAAILVPAISSFAEESWEQLAQKAEKLLYEEEKYDEAIAAYDKAIALKPENPALYGNRGNAYSYKGNLDKAVADYDKAIAIGVAILGTDKDPKLCYFFYNKAYAYDRVNRHAEAIPYYDKVVALDLNYPDAHGNLAWILATSHDKSLRDPKRAIKLAQHELTRLGGKSPSVMDTLAAAYAASGNFPEAIAWQEKALAGAESEAAKKEIAGRLSLYKAGKPYFQTK